MDGLSILRTRRSSAPEHVLSRGYAFNGRSVAVLGSSSRSTRITRKLFQISPGPRSSVNKADLRAGKDAGMIAAMRIPMSDFRNLLNGWILACVLAVAPAAWAQHDQQVYTDSLVSGWQNWSWAVVD